MSSHEFHGTLDRFFIKIPRGFFEIPDVPGLLIFITYTHTHTQREIIWTRFCEILCHSSITSQWIVQMGATETPTILTELSIEAFKTGICETSRSKRAQVARCNTNYNCLLNQILPGFSREGFFEGPGRKRLKMYTHSTVKRRDGGLSKSFSTEFLYPKYE